MPDAPVNLDAFLTTLGGRASGGRMRRIVVRFDPAELQRLDVLRARLPRSSRAAIVRMLCLLGVGLTQEHLDAKGARP